MIKVYISKPIYVKSNICGTIIPAKTYFHFIINKKGIVRGLLFKTFALTNKKNKRLDESGYKIVKRFKNKILWLKIYTIKHTTFINGMYKLNKV